MDRGVPTERKKDAKKKETGKYIVRKTLFTQAKEHNGQDKKADAKIFTIQF